MSEKTNLGIRVRKMTESGLMLAIAFALSMFPVMEMPFGGSVTAGSMFPVVLIAYRHGTGWGLFTGFAYALLQLLTGLKNLSYATSAAAGVAIVVLDYLAAFTVLGLAGLFRRQKNQSTGLANGICLVCALRYICHVITGCTVWAGVSIPSSDGLIYSLSYNAAYMIPEFIITLSAGLYLSRVLDFRAVDLRRKSSEKLPTASAVCNSFALLSVVLTVAIDALLLFASIQTAEGFDITGLWRVDWIPCVCVSAVGLLLAVLLRGISAVVFQKQQKVEK